MSTMHLIRFPNKQEHKKAIMALLDVPRAESLGLPDLKMVVGDDHLHALERAKISFTHVSQNIANGKITTPVQS